MNDDKSRIKLQWLFDEWREWNLGPLIVGGQALVERGLRDVTKDIDACIPSLQCAQMLAWLVEKERLGHTVELRVSSAPIHPNWLGNGWTSHVLVDGQKLDFFGVPMRSSQSLVDRFLADPREIAFASLFDLGFLKRTGRLRDWGDIEMISRTLRDEGDIGAMLQHLFGEPLVRELEQGRERTAFRKAVEISDQARFRPIFRLGLSAPVEDLPAMASAELSFWMNAGTLRSGEVSQVAMRFWRNHGSEITSGKSFAASHGNLLPLAKQHLPANPIADPVKLIESARKMSGVDRWPGLILPSEDLALMYFPAYREALSLRTRINPSDPLDHGIKP